MPESEDKGERNPFNFAERSRCRFAVDAARNFKELNSWL
jgi:hypothetical protein